MEYIGRSSATGRSDVGSGWSDGQQRALAISSFVSSCFSLGGSLFILVCFVVFFRSRRKQLSHRLVVYLSLCHLGLALCWQVTGPGRASALMCHVIAPIRYFLTLSSFFWTSAIATELVRTWYRARVNQFGELVVSPSSSLRREAIYHGASWCIPLFITLWPAIFQEQEEGIWQCWFEDEIWVIVFFSILGVSCLYCLVVYCLALFKFQRKIFESGSYSTLQESRRTELKLRIAGYLLAFLITWLPVTILQIANSITDGDRSLPLFVMTVISSSLLPLTGFLDSIIYGWDRKLWEAILLRAAMLCRCIGLDRRWTNARLLPQGSDPGAESEGRHRQYGGVSEGSEDTIVFSDEEND